MPETPRQLWKRFKTSLKKAEFDLKRFKDDFGPTLDEVEDLVETLNKSKDKLKSSLKEANRIADKYEGVLEDMLRECARDENRKGHVYDVRGALNLIREWLKYTEKDYVK